MPTDSAGEHQSNPQLSQNLNRKQARERRQKRQRGHVTGIRPDAQWNGNATGSARRNRLVALGFFSLNFNFMLLLLVFSNPGNLNIIVTGVTAIATSRGRTHHDQRCWPAAINDGVIFAAILIPSAAMHHQPAFPISSAGGGNCWWAATCAFGGNAIFGGNTIPFSREHCVGNPCPLQY